MRDFRDAKIMAHTLRSCLKTKAIDVTHSESLELIAKAFGFDNWNVLSAKIGTTDRSADAEGAASSAEGSAAPSARILYCSFCGKSQHDVRKLVAGPAVFICDTCIGLCTDFVEDPLSDDDLSRLAQWRAETAHTISTEELAHYVERSRRGVERNRLILQGIRRRLGMKDDEVLADDEILANPRLTYLKSMTGEELAALQQATRFQLGRDEDALRLATSALGARTQ